ncbi:Exosome component 3 [Branchiostoma belcheri]|nr:Exosome component 3 [Branchiostoma belcheri]
MVDSVGKVVIPGDVLSEFRASEKTSKVALGPGLRQDGEEVLVTKSGILRHKEPNLYWIDCHQRRYIPAKGEDVIGIVTVKSGDVYRVDIGATQPATLSYLAFEGATKRNRPNVKVGDLVFAKLLVANKDMEPELVCIDSGGHSSGYGVIPANGGFMFHTSLNLVRKMLSPNCDILKFLGKNVPFETAVGVNGRIWVKAKTVKDTIVVANAIASSEHMTNAQIRTMIRQLLDKLSGF